MFDSDRFKANKNSYKNILIFYFGFVTVRDLEYVKFNSVYPLYLIINKVNRYLKKLVEISILTLVPTNERKNKVKEHWSKIRDLVRLIIKAMILIKSM